MKFTYLASLAIAAACLAALPAAVTPAHAAGMTVDIDCDVAGHKGKCYDMDKVDSCILNTDWDDPKSKSCYREENEADLVVPPQSQTFKHKTGTTPKVQYRALKLRRKTRTIKRPNTRKVRRAVRNRRMR